MSAETFLIPRGIILTGDISCPRNSREVEVRTAKSKNKTTEKIIYREKYNITTE